jgi:hypothetical protein
MMMWATTTKAKSTLSLWKNLNLNNSLGGGGSLRLNKVVWHTLGPFAIVALKKYLKAQEELWKLNYISPCKNINNLQKFL